MIYPKRIQAVIAGINNLDHKVFHAFMLAFLFIFLTYRYLDFLVPFFYHLNFTASIDLLRIVTSTALMAVFLGSLFWFRPTAYMHATSVLFAILILIPNLVLHMFMPSHPVIVIAATLFVLLLRIPVRFQMQQFPGLKHPIGSTVFLLSTVLLLIPILNYYGVTLPGLALLEDSSQIYTVRTGMRDTIPKAAAYAYGQLGKALVPALLLTGLITKRYWISLMALVITGYLFFASPHKTLIILLIPFVFLAFWKNQLNQTTWFLIALVVAMLVALIVTKLGYIMPESLLVRRSLFTQAFITHAYFDFFQGDPLFLSHSFLGSWFDYPYATPPRFLIGELYFNAPEMSCNTGFIGDGFMNFGYVGVLFFTLATAAIFHLMNIMRLHPGFFGLTLMAAFHLQNGYLFTTMISHGLLLLLLIMLFIIRKIPVYFDSR